jgi:twitching motility protein PilI
MSTAAGTDLRSLRKHPFDLLQELERRSKANLPGSSGDESETEEWVGIAFKMDDERFVVARDEVREIMVVPAAITRVPGAKPWIRGLANARGHLLTIVDLKLFLGAGQKIGGRETRVLVVNSNDLPVGIIVDEVFGFRRFHDREHRPETPETFIRCERYLTGAFERGDESWPVFSLQRLLGSEEFQLAAE